MKSIDKNQIWTVLGMILVGTIISMIIASSFIDWSYSLMYNRFENEHNDMVIHNALVGSLAGAWIGSIVGGLAVLFAFVKNAWVYRLQRLVLWGFCCLGVLSFILAIVSYLNDYPYDAIGAVIYTVVFLTIGLSLQRFPKRKLEELNRDKMRAKDISS
ncbi:hypothetical protein JD969_12820 [Planctomycetota bacterium]|nr:hypothetical protein JD969_12820 [Planctomycetota bacterium]